MGFDPNAVFSTPLAVGTIIVLLFVFFGQLLFAAGGGNFFTDLAMALTSRSRGGAAKISIVGAGLFGSISGSAVFNVVTTGVVTIPLMQRGGYTKRDAGTIDAVASTGGQLTPPIMGTAAFLMAEVLDIFYFTVAAAALLPGALYSHSVLTQVDLIAGRDAVTSAETDILGPSAAPGHRRRRHPHPAARLPRRCTNPQFHRSPRCNRARRCAAKGRT